VGPWIGALQKVWENLLHQLGNRTPIVDLNDVTLIDDSADPLSRYQVPDPGLGLGGVPSLRPGAHLCRHRHTVVLEHTESSAG